MNPGLLWLTYILGQIQGMVQLALIQVWLDNVIFLPNVRPPGKLRGWLHDRFWRVVKWWHHWW